MECCAWLPPFHQRFLKRNQKGDHRKMMERQRESARKSWELVEQLYSWVEEVLALKSTTITIKCQVEKSKRRVIWKTSSLEPRWAVGILAFPGVHDGLLAFLVSFFAQNVYRESELLKSYCKVHGQAPCLRFWLTEKGPWLILQNQLAFSKELLPKHIFKQETQKQPGGWQLPFE